MKFFKDVNHRFFYYLISIIGVSVFYLWVTSSIGLQLTVNGLAYVVKNLTIEGVTGSIAGPICIQRLTYQDDTSQLSIEDLCLRWKKIALLRGKFHIKQLSLNEIRLIKQQQSNQSSFSFAPSWLQIDQIRLKVCEIQTRQWHLRANGVFDHDGKLYWDWSGYGSAWLGKLQIKGGKDYCLQWIPKTMADRQQSISTTHTTDSHKLVTLIEDDKNLSNYLHIWTSVDPKSFFKPNIMWQLDGRVEDKVLLQQLGLYEVEDKKGDKLSLRIQGQFNSSFKRLLSYLSHTKPHLWPYAPIHFKLAMNWKAPTRLFWGAFKCFTVQGKLYPSRILWKGHLEAEDKQMEEKSNQWKLVGESQLQYRPLEKLAVFSNITTDLKVQGKSITFFKDTDYKVGIVPDVRVVINDGRIQCLGKIYIPHAYFKLRPLKPSVMLDPDIYFVRGDNTPKKEAKWCWDMQLDFELGKAVYLYAAALNARLAGSLAIDKQGNIPATARGEIKLVEGDYYFGQRLQLDPASRLIFTKQLDNPNLDIAASHPLGYALHEQLTDSSSASRIGIYLKGSLQNPSLHLLLKPEGRLVNTTDELSYLMTGQGLDSFKGKVAPLLLSTVGQLGKGYLHYSTWSDFCRQFGIASTIQADELSWNTHFIMSKRLNSQFILSGKVGLIEPDYLIGCYSLGKHWVAGATCNVDKKAVGLEMAYQREWD